MNSVIDNIYNNKIFTVASGASSLISLILAIVLQENIILWLILSIQIAILIILFFIMKYNSIMIGRLDCVNLDIIGSSIELCEIEENGESDKYKSKDNITLIIRSYLSKNKATENPKAILELRFPSQIKMEVDTLDIVQRDKITNDLMIFNIPLEKEIIHISLKAIILDNKEYEKFLQSTKRIEVKLKSDLLTNHKEEYINIELS